MIYEQAKEAFEATKNGKKDVDAATGPSALAAASVEKHVMETKEDIAVSASQTNPLISLPVCSFYIFVMCPDLSFVAHTASRIRRRSR